MDCSSAVRSADGAVLYSLVPLVITVVWCGVRTAEKGARKAVTREDVWLLRRTARRRDVMTSLLDVEMDGFFMVTMALFLFDKVV